MSTLIVVCRFFKAYRGPIAFQSLVKDLKGNLEKGHFATWPCGHSPKCQVLSDEQWTELEERLIKAIWEDENAPGKL